MKTKYYDTHCHLNLLEDANELDSVIKNIYESNLVAICIGTNYEDSLVAIKLANEHKGVLYSTIGIHPNDTDIFINDKDKIFKEFEKLLNQENNIIGIGETGLDYYRDFSNRANQKIFFIEHINLAKKFNLPLIVHIRDAYDDVYEILKAENYNKVLIHCYSSNLEDAKRFIDIGCILSFSGVITFPKSVDLHEVAKNIPINKFVIETDAPWLSPIPFRGKNNVPTNVIYSYKKISEIRDISLDDLLVEVEKNVKLFFNLT
ncbi:MAG: TatD family hydrolase [Malacoplasma sp.]